MDSIKRSYVRLNSHILVGVFFVILLSSGVSRAQCALKAEYKVEKSNNGQNSDIHLKVIQGTGRIDFYLVDLNDPHKGPIQKETKLASDFNSDFVPVFKNVVPSRYSVQVIDANKCQYSVGGIEGILIPEN